MRFFTLAALMLVISGPLFTSCSDDMSSVQGSDEETCHLYARTSETKTVNDGLATKWSEGDGQTGPDALNVFHAESGSSDYSGNSEFVLVDAETGMFKTSRLEGDLAMNNDWFILYPYNEDIASPSGNSGGCFTIGSSADEPQLQAGNNNMEHVAGECYPMWGVVRGVQDKEIPSVYMTHLCSLLKIEITNGAESALVVESIALTAPESIVGRYHVDITSGSPSFAAKDEDSVSNTASLTVSGGSAIAPGGKGLFYMAVKPFGLDAGQQLSLCVNGWEKTMEVSDNVVFSPGRIKTVKFMYGGTEDEKKMVVYSSDPDWKSAKPAITWEASKFKPSQGMMSGSYAYRINVPEGFTAYVLSGSDNYFNNGDAYNVLSVEEKIDAIISYADKPSDVTKITDNNLYRQLGPPNGCEYYHYEHGSPTRGRLVIWASEEYHKSKCDCEERLSDTAKRNGVMVPITNVHLINDDIPDEIVQPDAVHGTNGVNDKVFVVCQDLNGRLYEPFEWDVPNYF